MLPSFVARETSAAGDRISRMIARRALLAPLFAALLVGGAPPPAQPVTPMATPSPSAQTLDQRIAAGAYAIRVTGDRLDGEGATILVRALAPATYVMLGEDHGVEQIADFASALLGGIAGHGFHTAAVEVGASVAPQLERWSARPSGAGELVAFQRRFPGTVAFYGWSREFAFLQRAQAATGGRLTVWGLDQELMGSGRFLLQRIAARTRSPRTRALVAGLDARARTDEQAAFGTGDPRDAFMIRVPDALLTALRAALVADGDSASLRDLEGFSASKAIYGENAFASYALRSVLMKRALREHLDAIAPGTKVFFKFGMEHLYRGFNPQRVLDLGNAVGEAADARGAVAVNVLVLALDGEQLAYTGYGKPFAPKPIPAVAQDAARSFVLPFAAHAHGDGPTLFDLRALRRGFARLRPADPEVERAIFGYDFLVLVPQTKAQHPLDPTAF